MASAGDGARPACNEQHTRLDEGWQVVQGKQSTRAGSSTPALDDHIEPTRDNPIPLVGPNPLRNLASPIKGGLPILHATGASSTANLNAPRMRVAISLVSEDESDIEAFVADFIEEDSLLGTSFAPPGS